MNLMTIGQNFYDAPRGNSMIQDIIIGLVQLKNILVFLYPFVRMHRPV